MGRGWTFIDDEQLSDAEVEERSAKLDVLAERWSQIHYVREQQHFDAMARRESGEDYEDDYPREPRRVTREQDPEAWADYDREKAEYESNLRERKTRLELNAKLEEAQLRTIEEEMHKLGARMMRPYEHWNEDEHYMQYHENGYFDDNGTY